MAVQLVGGMEVGWVTWIEVRKGQILCVLIGSLDFIPVILGTTEGFQAGEWCDPTCVSVAGSGCGGEGGLEVRQEAAGGERILKLNCGESVGLCGLFQEHTFLKTQLVPDWMR